MALPQRNSAQWVALRLLAYLGVTSLADPPPANDASASGAVYVTPGLLDDMAGILTAALQQIALDGPAVLSEVSTGAALFPPTSITLNVVQGNAATQLASGFLSWMVGCTVAIAGDGFQNEFVNGTGRLRRPYLGPTAQGVTATVYGNAVRLPISTRNVLAPVIVGGHGELAPATTREDFDRVSGAGQHCGWGNLRQGHPHCYFVGTEYDETLSYLTRTLRIAPSPLEPLPLSFRAKVDPLTITVDDLGDDDNDPAVMFPGVAGQYTESILLPYCLQLLTGHPLWKPDNPNAAAEIARRAALAKQRLNEFKGQASGSAGGYFATGYAGR